MKLNRTVQIGIIMSIAAIIILGVVMAGSPVQARKERIDTERSNRVQYLSMEISNYYISHKELPESLDFLELYDASRYKDPETNMWFVYEKNTDRSYTICATFATIKDDPYYQRSMHYPAGESETLFVEEGYPHAHGQGYQCFTYVLRAL